MRLQSVADRTVSSLSHGQQRQLEIGMALAGAPRLILFDERVKALASEAFAERLGAWKDAGEDAATFVIGGPDGLDPDLRAEADLVLSFGTMTWPHQLVRVMALEQLYRAMTILAGHPYHRA